MIIKNYNSSSKLLEDIQSLYKDDSYMNIFKYSSCLEEENSLIKENGWTPYHFVFQKKSELVCVIPAYIKTHSWWEYSFDHPFAKFAKNLNLDYYPKLQICFPFIPLEKDYIHHTYKNLEHKIILEALLEHTRKKFSSIHFTFPNNLDSDVLINLGFIKRSHIHFIWENNGYSCFDDFLKQFNSKGRNNIKRERRCIENNRLNVKTFVGKDIHANHLESLYNIIQAEFTKNDWGELPFKSDFLKKIQEEMPDNLLIVLAYEENEVIAGTLNFIEGQTIYGRFWGSIIEIKDLHFELCYYHLIEYSIKNRYSSINVGCTGFQKVARGFLPYKKSNFHWIKNNDLKEEAKKEAAIHNSSTQKTIEELINNAPFIKNLLKASVNSDKIMN